MIEAVATAGVLVGLLAMDWRSRKPLARVLALMLCLALWWYSLPNFTIAGRRASVASTAARVATMKGDSVSEYYSGIATMRDAMESQQSETSLLRLLTIGGLAWLAFSPVLRRDGASASAERGRFHET
jgi:hypothetical protein